MMSPRRTAQLGILSATAVLIISLGVLIMQGADVKGSRSSNSASVTPPQGPAPSMPLELSVASQARPTRGGQQ